MLGNLSVSLLELGDKTLNAVKSSESVTLLCSDVELTALVDTFGGLMSKESSLINIGDFVKYCDHNSATAEVKLCMMSLACISIGSFYSDGRGYWVFVGLLPCW